MCFSTRSSFVVGASNRYKLLEQLYLSYHISKLER